MARKQSILSKPELQLPTEAQIEQLLAAFENRPNSDIVNFMLGESKFIHCIKDDAARRARAAELKIECPEFNSLALQRLNEHVRSVRSNWNKRMQEIETLSEALGDGETSSFDDIEEVEITRFQVDNGPIDSIFGDGLTPNVYGPVVGKTYLLGGTEGVGKTRLLTSILGMVCDPGRQDIADLMVELEAENTGIVFQNEVPPATYKQWAKDKIKPGSKLIVSEKCRLKEQLAFIEKVKPLIVVVDSLHMIMECDNMPGVLRTLNTYRYHALQHNYTLILICHLNKAGDIAGSKKVSYLVDAVYKASGGMVPGQFTFSCPNKNRYGRSGVSILCQHTQTGVEVVETSRYKEKGQATFIGGPKPVVVLSSTASMKLANKPVLNPNAINKPVAALKSKNTDKDIIDDPDSDFDGD